MVGAFPVPRGGHQKNDKCGWVCSPVDHRRGKCNCVGPDDCPIGRNRLGLRDVALIARAKLLQSTLTAALAENPSSLAEYGLTPADATLLAKETADFEAIVADPAAAISSRKALTAALRPKFREVGELLAKMDRLVLRFRKTAPGTRFVETWQATRIIRDLGEAAAPATPAPPAA